MGQDDTQPSRPMIIHRNDLPPLPEYLIEEVYKSLEQRKNLYSYGDLFFLYEHMDATPLLKQWLFSNIDPVKEWSVQYFTGHIPAHTDWIFDDTKLNYLLTLGGKDTYTHWYDDDRNKVFSVKCEPGWHELTVNIPHNVDCVLEPRISITHKSIRDTIGYKVDNTPDRIDLSVKDYGFF